MAIANYFVFACAVFTAPHFIFNFVNVDLTVAAVYIALSNSFANSSLRTYQTISRSVRRRGIAIVFI